MVVSKCANESCSAVFHCLGQGKLFIGESHTAIIQSRRRSYAWLCPKCSGEMTVVFDKESGDPIVQAVRAA